VQPGPRQSQFDRINRDLLAPLFGVSKTYVALVLVLSAFVAAGGLAWIYQIQTGIGQTNLNPPIFWGVYIATFVFWVGVSHSGTFISGVLRLTKAEWRRPITRIAELMTLFSIIMAAICVFVHLGRLWRFYYMIPYPNQRELWPNFRSPLMWDATAILTYAVGSTLFLYLPLIPDFALARERVHGWRRPLYGILSMGWRGTHEQWHRLEMSMRIISVLIVMVMVSVHSIVGLDFAVALVPGWHSTVFPPLFVVGAVHSGMGMVVIALFWIRKIYRLEQYIETQHFDKMGKLIIVTTLVWGYLYFVEKLTHWYGGVPDEMAVMDAQLYGRFAWLHWAMIALAFVIPMVTLSWPAFRRWPLGLMVVGLLINIGMYIERVLIIIPSLGHPRLPYAWGAYMPSWIELTIMTGTLAFFALLYLLAIKFVPLISIWEEKEGLAHVR
jgi:molybdopterin-containing oxidoreductase family membrane subunit